MYVYPLPYKKSIQAISGSFLAMMLVLLMSLHCGAQSTFQSGWKTYKTGTLAKQYDYSFDFGDSVRLAFLDSIATFASTDSSVTVSIENAPKSKPTRTVNYLNSKKQVVKCEYYVGDALYKVNLWHYDTFNRITYFSYAETKAPVHNYVRTYSYQAEKTAEGTLEIERSSYNGKPEFTTEHYFNKKHMPLKDIRMNDVHQIEHIETFKYDANGHLKERSIFFPEFGVTKHFEEKHADTKCIKNIPLGKEHVPPAARELYMKRLVARNKLAFLSDDCPDLEYTFSNGAIDIVVTKEKEHNRRKISFTTRERLAPQEIPYVPRPLKETKPAKETKQQKEIRKSGK